MGFQPVLAVIASNEPTDRIKANLYAQTMPPLLIVVADRTYRDRYIGERVTRAMNTGLEGFRLRRFDWILRVDCDVILPADWLERSVKSGADVVGRAGYALLIRMKAFLAIGGEFPMCEKEDVFLIFKLASLGFRVSSYVVPVGFVREPGRGNDQTMHTAFYSGFMAYKLGYEPLHAADSFIRGAAKRHNLKFLFSLAGYFFAIFRRPESTMNGSPGTSSEDNYSEIDPPLPEKWQVCLWLGWGISAFTIALAVLKLAGIF